MFSASLTPNDYAVVDVPGLGPQADPDHFFAKVSLNPKCVKKLCYSGWNPVQGKRRLAGLFQKKFVVNFRRSFSIFR